MTDLSKALGKALQLKDGPLVRFLCRGPCQSSKTMVYNSTQFCRLMGAPPRMRHTFNQAEHLILRVYRI